MKKIPENIIQFYKDNPEMLETRILAAIQDLEDLLTEQNLRYLNKPCLNEVEKIWVQARKDWIFPEEKDIKKIIKGAYELYR